MTTGEVEREIERHRRLVYYVIYRYFPYLRDDEDAIQIGMIALCTAMVSYESDTSEISTYSQHSSRYTLLDTSNTCAHL